ncbi:MAG: DUF1080 domain-containing protein [Cyclobacteriaceae bacterium]|jgi:hypothetical protein|nr:DUF1080 domain-containing protein [Cyclobacteriaceae bacterium]
MRTIYSVILLSLLSCQGNKKEAVDETAKAPVETSTTQEKKIFNGTNLDGWKNYGGGKFSVEEGAIVGEAAMGFPNSFLATEDMYQDFELEIDFMIDSLLNSGIQIRSNTYPNETKTMRWGGRFKDDGSKDIIERTWEAGRFWGYQVEIDPNENGWSGALYEEGGRGFLHSPSDTQEASTAFKPNEWNHFRIKAVGDHFQTWLNGTAVVDMNDDFTKTGYIALQLHGIGKEEKKIGQKVQWKNIKLTVL